MFEAHVFVKSLCKKPLWKPWCGCLRANVLGVMSLGEYRIELKRMACRSDLGRDFDRYQTHPAWRVKTLLNGGQIACKATNKRLTT